jgi:Zn-dependent metalloprotease
VKNRSFRLLVVLVAVSLVLPAVAGAQVQATASGRSGAPAEGVRVSIAPGTGKARFVWLTAEQATRIAQQAGGQGGAEKQAGVFFEQYGSLFGVRDAGAELAPSKVQTDHLGTTHLSYNQVYQGVPVFAGVLRVHFDAQGLITAVNGTFIPDIALDPTPTLGAAEAAGIAEAEVSQPGAVAVGSTLMVYRENLARGLPGANHLAYEVEVTDGRSVREFVYLDAHTGAVVDRLTGIYDLDRQVYNQVYDGAALIWGEGDTLPFYSELLSPEINRDVNRVIDYAEDTYDMVANATGGAYLSYDGAEATMLQVVDVQTPDWCPNASWNGQYVQYCEGITGDDTVAHEWGHAYTQHTHNLVYAWQPGAVNESYSDIYGEVVDMINGVGLDEPDVQRATGACSVYTPLSVELEVLAPETIAGIYEAGMASFGPQVDGTVQGSLMIVDDGTGDTSTEGCGPLVNDLSGHIAFIRRGTCTFATKVKNAQDAGAIGAIIANHMAGGDDTMTMGGYDPEITIQSLFIGYTDGNTIQAEIESGADVVVRLDVIPPDVPPDDSVRWLSGEQDDGGAIRDLWNPSCYGDPDKVSSDDYTCSTDDQGGVHTNSGVPNHAFALLVDGGDFNGQIVTGIGLTKAFHIYWRAQSVYQVPATVFADHADALLQSCADLSEAGINLADLVTGNPSDQVITESDCDELGKVIAAVEFYEDPVCTGTPMGTYRYRHGISRPELE